MKRLLKFACIAAMAGACADDKPISCTESVCKDGIYENCIDGKLQTAIVCESLECADTKTCKSVTICTDNICQNGKIQECLGGSLQVEKACESGECADTKTCKSVTICTDNICQDGKIQECHGGSLQAEKACESGECADTKTCKSVATCTDNVCHNGKFQECLDGKLQAEKACESGECADAKTCKSAAICTDNICQDGKIQECHGGSLQAEKACESGECADSKTCKPAAVCTDNICQDGKIQACLDGKLQPEKACESGKCANATSCLISADPVILALWDFETGRLPDSDGMLTPDRGIMGGSVLMISNIDRAVSISSTGGQGGSSRAIYASGWSTKAEPAFILDQHWMILVETTGYTDIQFSYFVAGSSTNSKKFATIYIAGDDKIVEIDRLETSGNNVYVPQTLTWIPLPKAANKDSIYIGIHPYAVPAASTTTRLDNVVITGVPMH